MGDLRFAKSSLMEMTYLAIIYNVKLHIHR